MDFDIKSEPGLFDDTISQSAEFLDEKPIEQNAVNISEPSLIGKLKHKVLNNKKKGHKLSSHWRKRFFKAFQEVGCSSETVAKYGASCDVSNESVCDFFDCVAKKAEHYVYEECDSLSFNNITEWLKYMKAIGVPKHCSYEIAIVLNAIASNEYHPEPQSMDGINLKEIYKFLGNALMGLPQQQLDETSAKFLSDEFQNLINEANTDEADNDVRNMKRKIEGSLIRTINGTFFNLDPLNTNNEEIKRCYREIAKCNDIKK